MAKHRLMKFLPADHHPEIHPWTHWWWHLSTLCWSVDVLSSSSFLLSCRTHWSRTTLPKCTAPMNWCTYTVFLENDMRMSILHISLKLKVQKNALNYGNQMNSLYRSADMFSWSRAACEPQCCVYSSVCLKQIITIGLPSATVPIPLLDCIEPQMTRCFITIMALELSSIGRCVSLSADCCHDRE